MVTPLVIIGGGGFGREVYELLMAVGPNGAGWSFEGFVDDDPAPQKHRLLQRLPARIVDNLNSLTRRQVPFGAVIAIGDPFARQSIADRLRDSPVTFATLVHPQAWVGRDVRLGHGSIVCAGARLSTNISIGDHVHIDQNATIGHDATIGSYSRLNPQACVSGAVTIGERSLIGANSTVLQGLHIGSEAVVGAGAVVTRAVPDSVTVKGVPAK